VASRIGVRPERIGSTLLVSVSGELDIASAPRVREAVEDGLDDAVRAVVLELAGVGFLDSSGLRALIDVAAGCESAGRAFALASPSSRVERLLGMVGLAERFTVLGDVAPGSLAELASGGSTAS